MADNKTKPNKTSVEEFLKSVSEQRANESRQIIDLMQEITGESPVMWGSSIIGFGQQHYKYDTGREGDVPRLGFSPRKANLTIYFNEGLDRYNDQLEKLGKHKTSVSCLYINKLEDVNIDELRKMLKASYDHTEQTDDELKSVGHYIENLPDSSKSKFEELRSIVKETIPNANEVISYKIVGYKLEDKRAKVYISGWKDHVALYPVPKDKDFHKELEPHLKGKGTLWFKLDQPLPKDLIKQAVTLLIKEEA